MIPCRQCVRNFGGAGAQTGSLHSCHAGTYRRRIGNGGRAHQRQGDHRGAYGLYRLRRRDRRTCGVSAGGTVTVTAMAMAQTSPPAGRCDARTGGVRRSAAVRRLYIALRIRKCAPAHCHGGFRHPSTYSDTVLPSFSLCPCIRVGAHPCGQTGASATGQSYTEPRDPHADIRIDHIRKERAYAIHCTFPACCRFLGSAE